MCKFMTVKKIQNNNFIPGQKWSLLGWGFSSVVERLPRKRKALGSVPSSEKKEPKKKKKCIERRGEGWRDGSAVKSTDCSSRGLEFKSYQPHGGSQSSVMGSGALFWHQLYTHINTKIKLKKT